MSEAHTAALKIHRSEMSLADLPRSFKCQQMNIFKFDDYSILLIDDKHVAAFEGTAAIGLMFELCQAMAQ